MPPMPRRRQLVARMWRAVEAEVTVIEARLVNISPDDPAHGEGMKQLGLLARLIRDLVALDEQTPRKTRTAQTPETEDAAFANLVNLRAALEKRLEALVAQEEA
ncbi:MAG: hypothetical protein ACRCWO_01325 [Bosea sp. (in: a-proteobacteria)]